MTRPAVAGGDSHAMRVRMLRSTVAQSVGAVLVALISVTALHVATARLGPRNYGHLVTVISFVTLFTLFTDLGLNSIATRELARRPDSASQVLSDNLSLRCALGLVLIPLIAGAGLLLYPSARGTVGLGIGLMSADLVLNAAQTTVLIHYAARVRGDVAALVLLVDKVIYLALVVAASSVHASFLAYVGAYLLADLVAAVLAYALVRRQVALHLRFRPRAWMAILKSSVSMGLLTVVVSLYLWNGIIFVSLFRSSAEVAYYGVDFSFLTVLLALPIYFMVAIMPSLATTSEPDARQSSIQKALDLVAVAAAPIAVGGVLLRSDIVRALAGPRYAPAAFPFAFLVGGVAFSFFNSVISFSAVAMDCQGALLRVQLLVLGLDIACNVGLIPHFGTTAAGATVLGCEALSGIGLYRVVARRTGIRLRFTGLWKPLVASASMVPAALVLRPAWRHTPAVVTPVVAVAVLGTVYLAAILLVRGVPQTLSDTLSTLVHRRRLAQSTPG